MTTPPAKPPACNVIGPAKLTAAAGGHAAICAAIEAAASKAAPGTAFAVEVQVVSASEIAATVGLGGRALPEQRMAVSDANLDRASINRFAAAIAAQIAEARER